MIYLDANIFIHSLIGDDSKSKACSDILTKLISGDIFAGTSVLTWDEFFYALKREIGKEKTLEESKSFLSMPNLFFFNATNEIISKAQSLIERYSLDPRDAIHAATAIINKCDSIISDDSDFDKVKELKRVKV